MVPWVASSTYPAHARHFTGGVAQAWDTRKQEHMLLLETLDLTGFAVRPINQLLHLQADGDLLREMYKNWTERGAQPTPEEECIQNVQGSQKSQI